jgi:SAM-dependent methyltransferase
MSQHQPSQTIAEWRDSAPFWAAHSPTIRTMFAPLTEALIEDVSICEGRTVLDVAGGAGEPSLTIAGIVGPTGSVTCTDAVAEMVAAAAAEAELKGLKNIRFRQCTAEALPFPDDSFDTTVSRLGAMFFPDEAFSEILRVTRPGGAIGFAVWRESELNPFCYLVTDVMSRHVETPPPDLDAPGAFRFAESGKLAGVLRDEGAIDLRERVFKFDIAAPISPPQFWEMRSAISETLRTKLATLTAAEKSQIGTEVVEAVKGFFPHQQMKFPAEMLIVSGRKPK